MTRTPSPEPSDSTPQSLPDQQPPRSPTPQRRRIGSVLKITLGLAIAFGGAIGYWRLSRFVHHQLVPQVEQSLLTLLDRPVEMGPVAQFSPFSILFGETLMPPTIEDLDQGRVSAVRVTFNPLELLWQKELNLTVTLIDPVLLIDQDEDGGWVNTQLNEIEPGPIQISLSQLRLQNGIVALLPINQGSQPPAPSESALAGSNSPTSKERRSLPPTSVISKDKLSLAKNFFRSVSDQSASIHEWLTLSDTYRPVLLQDVRGTVKLRDENQWVDLDIKSQLKDSSNRRTLRQSDAGGFLHLEGQASLAPTDESPMFEGMLKTRRLSLATLALIGTYYLPQDLGTIEEGYFNSDVSIRVADGLGTNTGSSSSFMPDVTLQGDARIWDVKLQSPRLSQPISDLKGQFLFKGETINLKGIRAKYGDVRAIASGRLHLQDGYNIVADIPSVSVKKILAATGIELPVNLKGAFESQIKVTGKLDNPLMAGTLTNTQSVVIDRVRFNAVRARMRATTESLEISTVEALPKVGGSITGGGQIGLGDRPDLNLNIIAQELPGDVILRQLLNKRAASPLLDLKNPATGQPIKLGTVNSNINITGPFNRLQTTAQVQALQATFPTQGTITVADQIVSITDTTTELANGSSITTTGAVNLALQQWQGQVELNNLAFNQFPLNQIPLDQIPVEAIPPNPLISTDGLDELSGTVAGQVQMKGTLADFTPGAIALEGQLEVSDTPLLGTPLATEFRWSGEQLQIESLETPTLSANGVVNIPFNQWVPSLGQFDLGLTLKQIDLNEWELPFPESLYVAGMTDFDGRVFGTIEQPQLDGTMAFDGLTVNQIQFEPVVGPVQFSRDQGLAFDLRGNRDRLAANIDGALRPVSFDISHSLTAQTTTRIYGGLEPLVSQGTRPTGSNSPIQGQGWISPTINQRRRGDRLFAAIEQFPLAALNLKPAAQFQLGAVGGILNSNMVVDLSNWSWQDPNPLDTVAVQGKVAIAQPRLGYLAAECFQGDLQLRDGVADVQNGQLRLDRYPLSDSVAPLSACDGPLAPNEGRYTLNGRLVARPTLAFNGQIGVEQGHIQEWLKTLQFFDIQDFGRGLRPVQLGRARDIVPLPLPFASPSIDADSGTSSPPFNTDTEPSAQPSNTTLLRQLQRYAEIVALQDQKRRQQRTTFALPQLQELDGTFFGEINLAVTPEAGVTADFDLAGENWQWGPYTQPNQLIAQGEFTNGMLTFLPLRFEAGESSLNFAGSVGWGDDATGQFRATNVSVDWLRNVFKLPLDIDGNLNASAAITGSLQNPRMQGSVDLSEASLNQTPIQTAAAQFIYNNARLGIVGNMQLPDEPSDQPIVTEGDATETVEDSDASSSSAPRLISLRGSLPYRLPQATVEPERDDIELEIALKDDGIGLLNLLNEHFFWEDGSGTITLDVGGTLRQTANKIDFRPTITGTALVDDATFSARVLPAPLTDVTGDIRFDGDRITVNQFDGQFSDGDFRAIGVIPLIDPFTPEELAALLPNPLLDDTPDANLDTTSAASQAPLTLALNDLGFNLKGVYNGGVDGRIAVRGTALAPELGGGITLSDGRVSLPEPTPALTLDTTAESAEENVWAGLISTPELNNLQVTLGNDLLITRLPLLNFVATGNLNVNGPLQTDMSAIAPEGVIKLHSGQVNLFTTQFNLDRSHNNTATFKPDSGSDPILDVQLETSVLEDNRLRQPIDTNRSQSEVADNSIGDLSQLQTIRIQATINGPASQLFDSIELTSSPGRSEAEIVALMGGGFVDTLGRSEGFIGIANLAGTALFTSIQTLVSNAIGFSDFRVFPTVITNEDREEEGGGEIRTTSTLALAAELGVRITNELSVSALQLLTVEEPTQYNLRYQLDDEVLLRGSTNFSDDNRIILEFETRF